MAVNQMTVEVERNPITYTVEYKATWAADWTPDANLFPTSVQFALAPKIPTATVISDYGRVHTLGSGYEDVIPLDLAGNFIKITMNKKNDAGDTDTILWYGYCPAPADRIDGAGAVSDDTALTKGRTTYSCYGLEWFNKTVKRVLPFNSTDDQRRDMVIGNRSVAEGGASGVYEFAPENDAEDDWTGLDVVEHLLYNWKDQTGDVFAFDVISGIGTAAAELANIKGVWNFEGKNYYQAIAEIINPGNAFSFYVDVNETGTDTAQINVVPVVDTDITEGAETIVTANTTTVGLQLDTNPKIARNGATVRHLDNQHYDEIEVRGGPLRVAFTISTDITYNTDSVMDEGWSSEDETTYENAADDEARAVEDLESVFTRFTMPLDWNGLASGEIVLPQIDEDTGLVDPLLKQNYYLRNRVFDRTLPWNEIDNEKQPRRPFAVYIDSDDVWHRTEKPGDEEISPVGMKVLDDSLGIQLSTGSKPNHLIAENTFSGSSDVDPQWDYKTVLATVSMQTEENTRIVLTSPTPEPGELTRRKVINVPHLQVWYVVPNTVKSIDPSQTGEDGLVLNEEGEYTRDDTEKMLRIATLAQSFFGKKRQLVDVLYKSPDFDLGNPLGFFISETQTGEASQPIDTIISEIVYTLDTNSQTQQLKTSFFKINFQKIGRISGGSGLFGGRGFGRHVADEMANIPVRFGAAGGGSGWTPFYFAASKKDDTNVTITDGRRRAGADMSTVGGDDITVGATGYIYYELLYNGAYTQKFEWNAAPATQADEPGDVRAFREDICKVTVTDGKISKVEQIWPGHVIGVDGRSV